MGSAEETQPGGTTSLPGPDSGRLGEPTRQAKPRVAVVFGGRSSEHAISCVTAGSVLSAIDRTAYDVLPVGITTEGRWVLESDDPQRLAIEGGKLPEVDATRASVALASDPGRRELVVSEPGDVPRTLGQVDVVLPLLHGPWGEDGTVQGLLEMAGVRYVGSGVLASAVGMDKHYLKLVLQAHGLPVSPYVVIRPAEWDQDRSACLDAVGALQLPVFVKPARGGSSIGISRVEAAGDLAAAVEEARQHDPKVIVEQGVSGRELECGVLESLAGGRPDTSVVGEISVRHSHTFYDFAAKYLDDSAQLDVPADIPNVVADEVRRLAADAFVAVGCEGLARVDVFYRGDGRVIVNEINTMPGFTPISMFPRMWAASGLDYPALVDRLLRLALRRPTGLR